MTDVPPQPPVLDYAGRESSLLRRPVKSIPPRVLWLMLGGLIASLTFCWLQSPHVIIDRVPAALANSRTAVLEFARALDAFHGEYGHYPAGDNLALVRALHGDDPHSNPRRIDFLSGQTRINTDGAFCDGWEKALVLRRGTPLQIVYSIGANGIDEQGGGDDIVLPLPAFAAPVSRPTSRTSSSR
jgi:hypothetical protein